MLACLPHWVRWWSGKVWMAALVSLYCGWLGWWIPGGLAREWKDSNICRTPSTLKGVKTFTDQWQTITNRTLHQAKQCHINTISHEVRFKILIYVGQNQYILYIYWVSEDDDAAEKNVLTELMLPLSCPSSVAFVLISDKLGRSAQKKLSR